MAGSGFGDGSQEQDFVLHGTILCANNGRGGIRTRGGVHGVRNRNGVHHRSGELQAEAQADGESQQKCDDFLHKMGPSLRTQS